MRADLRALLWISTDLVRRLIREPQVVRSLLWPIALVPLTLMLTMLGFVWIEGDWPVAVPEALTSETRLALEDAGFTLSVVEEVEQAVAGGAYRIGTDGSTVYAKAIRGRALQVERVLRDQKGAPWTFATPAEPVADLSHGGRIMGVIGVLFALFGIVFGAGMVARDRDDGTLEAELGLGIRRWVHGAARLAAGTAILGVHYLLAMAVMHAILGIEGADRVMLHGLAACSSSVAIGLLVIGRGGLKAGFSGPLAAGLSAGTGLAALGAALPVVGQHIPIASLLTAGSGWTALVGAALLGAAATAMFAYRSARAG